MMDRDPLRDGYSGSPKTGYSAPRGGSVANASPQIYAKTTPTVVSGRYESDGEDDYEEVGAEGDAQACEYSSIDKYEIEKKYKHSMMIRAAFRPSDRLNSMAPVVVNVGKSHAAKIFVPDPYAHIDESVRSADHKHVAIDKAMITGAGVTAIYNSSSYTVGVEAGEMDSSGGWEPLDQLNTMNVPMQPNSAVARPEKFFLVVNPDEKVRPADSLIFKAHDSESNLVKAYAHLSPETLKSTDVQILPHMRGYAGLRIGSPYMSTLGLCDFCPTDDNGNLAYTVRDGWAIFPEDVVYRAIAVFEDKILPFIRHVDLNKLSFAFHVLGPGKTWSDFSGTNYDSYDSARKECIMNSRVDISLQLFIEVAYPKKNPPQPKTSNTVDIVNRGLSDVRLRERE